MQSSGNQISLAQPVTLAAVVLWLGSAVLSADSQWIETRRAHYTIFHRAGYEQDAEFIRTWLDSAEQLMKSKYGVSPDRYHVSVYLYPEPDRDLSTSQSGQLQCCTNG